MPIRPSDKDKLKLDPNLDGKVRETTTPIVPKQARILTWNEKVQRQLAKMPVAPPPVEAQSDDGLMEDHLQSIHAAIIQNEIANDPEGIGYIELSNAEKVAVLNNPQIREVSVDSFDEGVPVKRARKIKVPCRLNIIMRAVPGGPNTITEGDL